MKKTTILLICLFFFLTLFQKQAIFAQKVEEDTVLTRLLEMEFEDLMKIVIVSASQQSETLDEVPVPVTVINEEMIRNSGARNLRDLLALYVPNMNIVQDHNEMNIAMRGVYASSQQKILVMLNGHRMNSRSYSEANPNYSFSLEKIKRIEILRGPASSLYGNVALTSVVNIITKTGDDINGGSAELGYGNYGQRKIALLYGEKFNEKTDLTFWANFFQSDGQEIAISKEDDFSANPKDGYAIVDGNKDKPSYDVGFNLKANKISMMGNLRYSKLIEPFSGGGPTGEVYNYSDYRTVMGTSPGLGTGFAHLDAKYENTLAKKWNLSINPYFDHANIDGIIVINSNTKQFGNIAWSEYSTGFIAQLGRNYEMGALGKGNVLVGTQVDHMFVYDSYFLMGVNGELSSVADKKNSPLLTRGGETIYSGFLQLKHYFSDKMIANLGMRYDEKDRFQGDNVRNVSPRLALIYLASDKLNFKLSYANSFVDAPYWYRYNSLASYKGSANLLPEKLSSLQFTPSLQLLNGKFFYHLNIFYNHLTNFIYRDLNAQGDEPRYRNAGSLKSWGIEHELSFQSKMLKIRSAIGQQYVIESQDYTSKGTEIGNIPSLSASMTADFIPFPDKFNALRIHLDGRYVSSQFAPIFKTMKNGLPYENLDNRIGAYTLFSGGVRIDDIKGFTIDARIFNMADVAYKVGGSVNFPYQQAGRWYLITLGYKFKNK